MVAEVLKALTGPFATSRPSNLQGGVLDFLGGALGRKYCIAEHRMYHRQLYYTLVDAATGPSFSMENCSLSGLP